MSTIVLNTKNYTGPVLVRNVSTWTERSSGIAAGFSTADMSVSTDAKVIKGKATLKLPILATEDSSCSCAGSVLREGSVFTDVRMGASMSTAERTDLYLRYKDFVNSAQFRALFEDLEVQV